MITLDQARSLKRRSCDHYRRIRHRNGVEWLVHSVLGNGCLIYCHRMTYRGMINRIIPRCDFDLYSICRD